MNLKIKGSLGETYYKLSDATIGKSVHLSLHLECKYLYKCAVLTYLPDEKHLKHMLMFAVIFFFFMFHVWIIIHATE